jgi:hypothetical protein
MKNQPNFFESDRPIQILAAVLALLILVRALPPVSFYIAFMQEASWVVGP